ncbi:hypothetical protein JCM12178A_32920 [Salidesulfovibrio brasiliensis]
MVGTMKEPNKIEQFLSRKKMDWWDLQRTWERKTKRFWDWFRPGLWQFALGVAVGVAANFISAWLM